MKYTNAEFAKKKAARFNLERLALLIRARQTGNRMPVSFCPIISPIIRLKFEIFPMPSPMPRESVA